MICGVHIYMVFSVYHVINIYFIIHALSMYQMFLPHMQCFLHTAIFVPHIRFFNIQTNTKWIKYVMREQNICCMGKTFQCGEKNN